MHCCLDCDHKNAYWGQHLRDRQEDEAAQACCDTRRGAERAGTYQGQHDSLPVARRMSCFDSISEQDWCHQTCKARGKMVIRTLFD